MGQDLLCLPLALLRFVNTLERAKTGGNLFFFFASTRGNPQPRNTRTEDKERRGGEVAERNPRSKTREAEQEERERTDWEKRENAGRRDRRRKVNVQCGTGQNSFSLNINLIRRPTQSNVTHR